ncbi:hypothetical protein HMPREF1986_02150, partial [Oribacterium sp. oral taxon 078 str. F0263]
KPSRRGGRRPALRRTKYREAVNGAHLWISAQWRMRKEAKRLAFSRFLC